MWLREEYITILQKTELCPSVLAGRSGAHFPHSQLHPAAHPLVCQHLLVNLLSILPVFDNSSPCLRAIYQVSHSDCFPPYQNACQTDMWCNPFVLLSSPSGFFIVFFTTGHLKKPTSASSYPEYVDNNVTSPALKWLELSPGTNLYVHMVLCLLLRVVNG